MADPYFKHQHLGHLGAYRMGAQCNNRMNAESEQRDSLLSINLEYIFCGPEIASAKCISTFAFRGN